MLASADLQRVTQDTELVEQRQNPRAKVSRTRYKYEYLISTSKPITFLNPNFQICKNEASDP